jgi:hypothetical protein
MTTLSAALVSVSLSLGSAGETSAAALEPPTANAASVGQPSEAPIFSVPILHSVALMGVMRATEAFLWPQPFAESSDIGWHYEQAYTKPPKFDSKQGFMRWDGDPLFVNVVGHGLFGSELYLRARQCRLGWAGSLVFAAAASTAWEYVVEANGVRPSAQDLIYTPLAGLVLGEGRYFVYRAAGGISSKVGRSILRGVVDPLGEIERAAGTDC